MKAKGTSRGLFILAFIFALLTAYLSYTYLSRVTGDYEEPETETVKMWVARDKIFAREIISEDMIIEVDVPIFDGYDLYIKNSEDIIGKMTVESIMANEGFPPDRLMKNIEEELSLKIYGSMRAVSISVNRNTGVSDRLRPGDRVDIFLFLPALAAEEEILRPDITKLMLQNIEVLTVRNNYLRKFPEGDTGGGAYDITIAVPVLEIEKLYMAEQSGSLKLALRPFSGDTYYNSYGTIWEELLLDQEMKHRDFFPEYGIQEDLAKVTEDKLGEYEELIGTVSTEGGIETDEQIEVDRVYTVQYGDTLIKISTKLLGSGSRYVEIKKVNGLRTNKIYPGQQLKIPKVD